MDTEHAIPALRARIADWRARGQRIALVPTMGNLHAGHLSLVEAAQARAERVVVSIFVNPMQFNDKQDFASYPRTLEDDRRKLEDIPVDLLFLPEQAALYPRGLESSTRVTVPGLSDILCGAFRPGHFAGVTTVVCMLLNIVQPDLAVFGEKDFQQLLLIRRMAHDLHLPVEIVGMPTRREEDGLAMSSRNHYLTPEERRRAPALFQMLSRARETILQHSGACDFRDLEADAMERLRDRGLRPEYFSVRRAADLALAGPEDKDLVVLAAAWLGSARLIDNVRVQG